MYAKVLLVLTIGVCLSSACVTTATPTAVATFAPVHMEAAPLSALPTPSPILASERTMASLPRPIDDHYAPPDVPTCKGAQSLAQPIKVDWDNVLDVMQNAPDNQWTFYHCGQSQSSLSAFYRQWLIAPEYSWLETRWEERASGILAVYNNSLVSPTHSYRWLYLWFLADQVDPQSSYLIAAWWNTPHMC